MIKKILFGLISFVTTIYIFYFLYDIIDLKSSALNPNNREILSRGNEIWIFTLTTTLLHSFLILCILLTFYIKKLRPIGIGLLTAFLLTSTISIKAVVDKSDSEVRIVTFDSKTWKDLDKKPISMARDIFLNWGHCQDKQTLIELLGDPFENGQSNEIGDYEKDVLANSLFYKTDVELTNGLPYYLIFHFPTSNADCNSINLRVLGENAQINLNKYID